MVNHLGDGELSMWLEYNRKYPIGNRWFQTGLLCSTVANASGNYKKTFKAEDFMPHYQAPLTAEQIWRRIQIGFASMGVLPPS